MNRLIGAGKENGGGGAISENENFRLRGKRNQLSDVGKVVLERMQSGKYTRNVKPYSQLIFRDEHARCLREGILFEDPEFPANDSSIYYRNKPEHPIVWKRPGEIAPEPTLIVGGHSRFDVNQGLVLDCWFMAAVANLTLHDELFYRVVPPDQDFTPENYAGIFHFQFWRYGEWVDVVVDDRLPYYKDKYYNVPQLHYVRSTNLNEFWSALLEKAYAKLHGSYQHLDLGFTNDALVDLTGGVPEQHEFANCKRDDIIKMLSGNLKNSFFGPYIWPGKQIEMIMENGLVKGHAYSVTYLEKLDTKDGQKLTLIRLRNPWGQMEWLGSYCDSSPEWNNVPDDKRISLRQHNIDGEFWMSLDDFLTQFQALDVCRLPLHEQTEIELMTGIPQPKENTPVLRIAEHGSWCYKERTTRKRCYPTKDKYNNDIACSDIKGCLLACPQYLLTVESDPGMVGQQNVVITLLQKHRREQKTKGVQDLHIGFSIYKAPKGTHSRVDQTFIQQNKATAESNHIDLREVRAAVTLDPGDYIIIPFKTECYYDGEFLLRMFSNAHLQTKLLK